MLPQRNRRLNIGIGAFAFFLLAVLFVILPPQWHIEREQDRRRGCRNNLHLLSLAMQSYLQDNDSHYPPTTISGSSINGYLPFTAGSIKSSILPVGWADALTAYTRSTAVYMCPAEFNKSSSAYPAKVGYTDYWMNAHLSGKAKSQVISPSTLLLGEGNNGYDRSNATYSQSALPSAWLNDQDSPAWRHLDGANYLMTDGAIHWLRPQEVTHFGGRKDAFALK